MTEIISLAKNRTVQIALGSAFALGLVIGGWLF